MKATAEMTYTSHHNTHLDRKIKMIQQLSSCFLLETTDGYN